MSMKFEPLYEQVERLSSILIQRNDVKDGGAIDNAIRIIQEQDERLKWWLETYDITMPCGHKNRYLVPDENNTEYCAICVLEATQLTIMNLVNVDDEPKNQCPMCETRARLGQMQNLLDDAPEIHSRLYDDATVDLSNQISNAISLFQCMCDEVTEEK